MTGKKQIDFKCDMLMRIISLFSERYKVEIADKSN